MNVVIKTKSIRVLYPTPLDETHFGAICYEIPAATAPISTNSVEFQEYAFSYRFEVLINTRKMISKPFYTSLIGGKLLGC